MRGSRKDKISAGMLPVTLCVQQGGSARALRSCSTASGCALSSPEEESLPPGSGGGILLNKLQPKGRLLLMKLEGKFLLEGIS